MMSHCRGWAGLTMTAFGALMFAAHGAVGVEAIAPELSAAKASDWRFVTGDWEIRDGMLSQRSPDRLACALLTAPAVRQPVVRVEFKVDPPTDKRVGAAAICLGATGTLTYLWAHFDTRHDQVILVWSTPENSWQEIGRKPCPLDDNTWIAAEVRCAPGKVAVNVGGKQVIECNLEREVAGCVGLGTSQGVVSFRQLSIEGEVIVNAAPLKNEEPPYRVISRGPAAGEYQAFPDACRLQNGDIMAVFYAGYSHISLACPEWPKGGRICTVRSSDEGKTWSEPAVLYDDEIDNRDPHIVQLRDGTLVCTFFSITGDGKKWDGSATGGKIKEFSPAQIIFSRDGGKTWDPKARDICPPGWVCSAAVRELPDGTLILGVYMGGSKAHGGVLRSADGGKTWSEPIPIDKDSGVKLDAETDVILLKNGDLLAALRGDGKVNMHFATSSDKGLTWGKVQDSGFKGHCPHFTRLSTGEIVLCHRLPATSVHVSADDGATWSGPHQIDSVGCAYPATVELKDGSVLIVYYEEGAGSAIRIQRLSVKGTEVKALEWK